MMSSDSKVPVATFSWVTGCAVLACGVGLTWIFWQPLWAGAGLIGGDIYPYYFPQKAFLADALRKGEIPLWNSLVGFGYPTLGESQTGVLYPFHLLLYSQLDLNTAYNVSQLLHYMLAFVAAWALARRLGLSTGGGLYAATAFVYGWFPARICLEWAIIGGAWFVAILWALTVYLQTRQLWALAVAALFLGMDLLAGHYNLAFITVLVMLCLPFLVSLRESGESKIATVRTSSARLLSVCLCVAMGFAVAAVQLLPSWELKTKSQRQEVNDAFAPTYGHLPPLAISQLWQPWSWHAQEETTDQLLANAKWCAVPNSTNQAEAFVYCGLLTVVLIVAGCVVPAWRGAMRLDRPWGWLFLGGMGLVFATGWPTYYLSNVPGFGFFRGPGRYSMVTVLAFAIVAGAVLDAIFNKLRLRWLSRLFLSTTLLGLLVVDLWAVAHQYSFGASPYFGRRVFYATMVDAPPVSFLEESELRKFFQEYGDNARLYAPGQNVPTLLGVSSLPVYLGLGPEVYETDAVRFDFQNLDEEQVEQDSQRLRDFGVTHLLLENPIDESVWNMTLLAELHDAFLNRAFARREPYYFYAVNSALGRAYVKGHPEIRVDVNSTPNEVNLSLNSPETMSGEEVEIVLTDLNYPGWKAECAEAVPGLFRSCRVTLGLEAEPTKLVWSYRPRSVIAGAAISAFALILTLLTPILVGKIRRKPSLKEASSPVENAT